MRRRLYQGLILGVLFLLIIGCKSDNFDQKPYPNQGSQEESGNINAQGTEVLSNTNLTEGCVKQYIPEKDYFPEKITIKYTKGFNVQYFHNYKLVTLYQPDTDGNTQIQYLLVQCGTPPPKNYPGIKVINVPVKNIVAMSTTYLPFLDQYHLLNRLVAIDDNTYVNNSNVINMVKNGKLVTVGGGSSVNIERLINLNPELIMAYNSGVPDYDAYPKINEAGLSVVLNGDNLETNPLGRTEWGKYIALFFNKERQAEDLFNNVILNYEQLVSLAKKVDRRPTVFVNVNYQGTWYMAGGKSYVAQFLSDAGANYLWADTPMVAELKLSFEEVLNKAIDADFWINTGFWNSAQEALADDSRYGEFMAFKNNQIYNNNARSNSNGGNDYFESGVANPDIILADLIKIFHPELFPDHQLYYYRQLTPLK